MSNTVTDEQLRQALDSLNACYGRGKIVHVQRVVGRVVVQKQYGIERPAFRLVRRTVFFRGHQHTIKK